MILVPTILFSLAGGPWPQAAESRQEPLSARAEEARELVLRALGGQKSPALADDLAALGPEAIPFLLSVLAKGGVSVGADPEQPLVLEAKPDLQEALRRALAGLPREPVIRALHAAVASHDVEERLACVRVLGELGTHEHLELLAGLAAPVDSGRLVPAKVRAAFQEALVSILGRDRRAFARFGDVYAKIPQALIFPMIRAAEEEAPVRAIELMGKLLSARPEADSILLSQMARLADASDVPAPDEVRERTRRFLHDADAQRLSAAVTLAGALDDHEAVPDLTRLLGHENVQVARGARGALKRIARKDLGRKPEPWAAWYETESYWWTAKSHRIAQDMVGRDPAKAAAAVMELGARRIRRDDAARILAEGLARPEPDIVRTCCQAIGHLKSSSAVPALETATQHGDAKVREAANEALSRIRGAKGA